MGRNAGPTVVNGSFAIDFNGGQNFTRVASDMVNDSFLSTYFKPYEANGIEINQYPIRNAVFTLSPMFLNP